MLFTLDHASHSKSKTDQRPPPIVYKISPRPRHNRHRNRFLTTRAKHPKRNIIHSTDQLSITHESKLRLAQVQSAPVQAFPRNQIFNPLSIDSVLSLFFMHKATSDGIALSVSSGGIAESSISSVPCIGNGLISLSERALLFCEEDASFSYSGEGRERYCDGSDADEVGVTGSDDADASMRKSHSEADAIALGETSPSRTTTVVSRTTSSQSRGSITTGISGVMGGSATVSLRVFVGVKSISLIMRRRHNKTIATTKMELKTPDMIPIVTFTAGL